MSNRYNKAPDHKIYAVYFFQAVDLGSDRVPHQYVFNNAQPYSISLDADPRFLKISSGGSRSDLVPLQNVKALCIDER